MTSIAATSNQVLKSFIAGANAQYRDAGLPQYQMRLKRDGSVDVPGQPAPKFGTPAKAGSAAADQARVGAASAPSPSAGAGAQAPRSGQAPVVSDLAQVGPDAFKLSWKPVAGAKQYGIWQDGVLLGHVPSPSFAGKLADGGSGVIQVDAVRADGTRTELTRALRAARSGEKISFQVPGATGAATAPQGATAPAAAAS